VSDDDKPAQTMLSDIQDAQKKLSDINSIPGATEIGVNAIDHANTTMTGLDTINATYLQPLKTFNTVVNTLANVCFVTCLCSNPV